MYKIGDYLMYRRDVCKVVDIKETKNGNNYVLVPINDESLKIQIPCATNVSFIRNLITKEEIEELIKKIPEIEIIETNNKLIENEYKLLLNSNNHLDLIKIIKTTYLRNKERTDSGKKIGDKDKHYFDKAEEYLYNEFKIVLNKTYEETRNYIIENVKHIEVKNEY